MKIKLEWYEIAVCAGVGVRRKVESLRTALNPIHQFKAHGGFEIDIQGACGEMAVAKALGLYWGGDVGTFHKPDVGPFQVRTRVSDYPYLALRPKDNPDHITILVAGQVPNFEVKGWIRNRDGKKQKYLRVLQRGRPPAFAVPDTRLRSIESLPHTSLQGLWGGITKSSKRLRSSPTRRSSR